MGVTLWYRLTINWPLDEFTAQTHQLPGASLVAQMVKKVPVMQEKQVWALGWQDPPGEGNGNPLQYSCRGNPWTEEPGRL